MEPTLGTHKVSKFASEDVISNMPENVISHIMDCLPVKDAVRTGILSRNWRFKWTLLTQLVFDEKFFEPVLQGENNCSEGTISKLLLQHKGAVTKFVLYIPKYKNMNVEDVGLWVLFLSRKGIKEFTVINMHQTPLKLPSHIFSCLELTFLKLRNCCFHLAPSYCGFPNLLELDFTKVRFESRNVGEFITKCPLLGILKIYCNDPIRKVKPTELTKLENLRNLSFTLSNLENIAIKSSDIFELVGFLPKLEKLHLGFHDCKLDADVVPRVLNSTAFPCLKTLTLYALDFGSLNMLSVAVEMIWGSRNLRNLIIRASYNDAVQPPFTVPIEVDYSRMRKLRQLNSVVLSSFRGSKVEVHLIKSILACSPSLKQITIRANSSQMLGGENGKLMFATKLLNLHRASPTAEVNVYWS